MRRIITIVLCFFGFSLFAVEYTPIIPQTQAPTIDMQPVNNIAKNLVYSGSRMNVKMTMINGQILYEDGKFAPQVDPEEIYAQANIILKRLR